MQLIDHLKEQYQEQLAKLREKYPSLVQPQTSINLRKLHERRPRNSHSG